MKINDTTVILGIDPGLANTGWGIIQARGMESRCMAYGCITTSADDDIAIRLHDIFSEIQSVVRKYNPTEVAIEEVFFGVNTKSALLTSQARGAALVAVADYKLITGEYTPLQIKQAVVGAGRAEKEQVQYMVRRLLHLDHDPKPDHAADALAAAVCHSRIYRHQRLLSKMGS